jgi:hypothetical protein
LVSIGLLGAHRRKSGTQRAQMAEIGTPRFAPAVARFDST